MITFQETLTIKDWSRRGIISSHVQDPGKQIKQFHVFNLLWDFAECIDTNKAEFTPYLIPLSSRTHLHVQNKTKHSPSPHMCIHIYSFYSWFAHAGEGGGTAREVLYLPANALLILHC